MIEIRAEFMSEKEGVQMSVVSSSTTKDTRLMELGAIAKYAHDQLEMVVKEIDQAAVEMLGGEVDQDALN